MIIASLNNADRYVTIHPLFAAAFSYIENTDLNEIAVGTYAIAEGLKAIISEAKGKAREDSLRKFECHDKFIDIQLCIRGNETIGWKPRKDCVIPNGEYNSEKDVRFFGDLPDMYFQLRDGQFGIFFPEDVHAPMIGDDIIRKLVIKVKI